MTGNSKPVRLLYITYNENVLDSGILYNQVRGMLHKMTRRSDVEYVRLLSFISPRLYLRRRSGYKHLKGELRDKGIDFKVRLMPAATRWHWSAIPLMILACLPSLLMNLLTGRINMLHARSYGAGLLAFIASRVTGVRMIFDPRGPFPEEMVVNGIWDKKGTTYRLWKWLEINLIIRSNAVIAVSPLMKKQHKDRGAAKVLFVPNRADNSLFCVRENPPRRNDIAPVLLFTGEMDAVWNMPERVAGHFLCLKDVIPDLKLKLVTRRDPEFVQRGLEVAGVDNDDWLLEAAEPGEMPELIANSDFGLILGLTRYRTGPLWPVKLAEYLLMGVPLVVEHTADVQITRFVKRWNLGMVVNKDDPESYDRSLEILEHRREFSERCVKYAELKLDLTHTAHQYARLYRQLLRS